MINPFSLLICSNQAVFRNCVVTAARKLLAVYFANFYGRKWTQRNCHYLFLLGSTVINRSEAYFCVTLGNHRVIPWAETKFIKGAVSIQRKVNGVNDGCANSNWPGGRQDKTGWGAVQRGRQIFAASWAERAERPVYIHEPTMDPCSRITLVMYDVCSILNCTKI